MMVDCDRVFRVHSAACRAGRPRSGSLAQCNPPPTNRYCPHRHRQQQHPGLDGRREKRREPGEEERTERRDETGLFHLEKGCVWRAEEERWRQGVDRREVKRRSGRRRRKRWGRKRPLCYPELSVSVCMSVLTQSKSICHQDCHCGTKREGSLPGRTHSERNGEKTRQARGGRVEFRRRVGGAWLGMGTKLLVSKWF